MPLPERRPSRRGFAAPRALALAAALLAAPSAAKKDDGSIDPDHLLPIDYLKVEDVHQWLTDELEKGNLHPDTVPGKFKENSVQGTTLKWLGAMGRGDKQKEELLEKVGCSSQACYKKFSQAVTAMYIKQRNERWNPRKNTGDADGGELEKVTPEEVQKMRVPQLQRLLKSRGVNPAAVGSEKKDLRRRALLLLQDAHGSPPTADTTEKKQNKEAASQKQPKKEEPKKQPKKEEPKKQPKKDEQASKAKKQPEPPLKGQKAKERKSGAKAAPTREEDEEEEDEDEWEECEEGDEDCEEYEEEE